MKTHLFFIFKLALERKLIWFSPSEGSPPAVASAGSFPVSLGRGRPVGLLPVFHLRPPSFADPVLLLAGPRVRLGVRRHPWDGPALVAVTRASPEVGRRVRSERGLVHSVELPRVSLSRRGGVRALPAVPPPGRGAERRAAAVVFVPASARGLGPLQGGVGGETGKAAVPGVEVQRREVPGESVLGRGGAPGLVDGCNLLVLNGHLGPPHRSSVGILVAEVGEEGGAQDRVALGAL